MVRTPIPDEAYTCAVCRSTCACHDGPHVECPLAEVRPCEGRCGRKTTAAESCRAGWWCRACVHTPRNKLGAWTVQAMVVTGTDADGEEELRAFVSDPSSYSDALDLGFKLDDLGARDVHLVEVTGVARPRSRPKKRTPAPPPEQLAMFSNKRRRKS